MGYEQDVVIDASDLPKELMRQPQLVVQYGEEWAERKAEKERLRELIILTKTEEKAILEHKRSLIELEIRRDGAEVHNVDKLTESVVQSLVNSSTKYKQAREDHSERVKEVITEYSNAVKEYNAYGTAMEAFRDKRSSLEGLIKMQLNNLYSEVRVGAGGSNLQEEVVDRNIQNGRESLQRSIKRKKKKKTK